MNLPDTQLLPLLPALKAGFIALWLGIIFATEGHWRNAASHARRWARHAGLWAINNLLSVIIILPLNLWASRHPLIDRPDGIGQMVLNIILLDLALYGWHRLCHHAPFLWRFHRVHHLDQMLDSTSALRFHGGEILCAALVRAPLIMALGIDWGSVVLFETLVLMASIFHHAALHLPPRLERRLSLVIVTPNWHHQHHHPTLPNTNSHYATLFSIWDRLWHSHPATGWHRGDSYGLDHEQDRSLIDLLRLR